MIMTIEQFTQLFIGLFGLILLISAPLIAVKYLLALFHNLW